MAQLAIAVSNPGLEPGVVASGVYAGGRRVADIAIEEAGDWSRKARPCGLDRPVRAAPRSSAARAGAVRPA